MHPSPYAVSFPDQDDPERSLLFSTKRAATITVPIHLLSAMQTGDLTPGQTETLTELGFLVADPASERQEMLSLGKASANLCSMIAVMNLDCNLACKYCYEGTLKGRRYMAKETAVELIGFARSHMQAGRDVDVTFYGGEPLLSMEAIRFISRELQAAAEANGVRFIGRMVSNGVLFTRQRAEELVDCGLTNIKVTLDGPAENHDHFRPLRTGGGSFATIVKNLRETCDLVKVELGGNYTEESWPLFPKLLDQLIEAGISPERLRAVRFAPVTKTSKAVALPDFQEGVSMADEPWVLHASVALREEVLRRGFFTPPIEPSSCMLPFVNDFTVNYDGTLFKCPAFMGWEKLSAGHLRTGLDPDIARTHDVDAWKNEECLACKYLPLCFGGCKFMRLLKHGSMEGVECRKAFWDATLEASVRQDLKYIRNQNRTT